MNLIKRILLWSLVTSLVLVTAPSIMVNAVAGIPAPTITSIFIVSKFGTFAAAGNNGTTSTVTITGTNLTGVTSVTVYQGITPDPLVTTKNILPNYSTPDTKLTVDIKVESTAPAGPRNITVTTSSGTSAAATGAFTVYRATVNVSSPLAVSPGANFDVYINVNNVACINASQFDLLYNKSAISVVGDENGTGVSAGLIGQTEYPIPNWGFIPPGIPGRVRILGNFTNASGVCGNGYMAKITFRAVAAAGTSSDLSLPADSLSMYNINVEGIFPDAVSSSSVTVGLGIISTSLPEATKGVAYSCSLSADCGVTPYTWSATGLPGGLTLNSSTGVISGTPTATGQFPLSISVTDSAIPKQSKVKTLNLAVCEALQITSASPLPGGQVGANYTQTLTAAGGQAPYSWSIQSGTLPSGLLISPLGVISGTPTASSGPTNIIIKVTDSLGVTATREMAITIIRLLTITTTSPLPAGVVGMSYIQTLTADEGVIPYSWSLQSGSLPTGLTMTTAGVISGIPTTSGNSTFTVMVTDGLGDFGSKEFNLNVKRLIELTVAPSDATVLFGTTQQFTAIPVYSDGSHTPTPVINWSSSDGSKVNIDSTTGLATAVDITDSPVTITATSGYITGTASIIVTQSVNMSIEVVLQGGSRPDSGFNIPITVKFFSRGTINPVDVLNATPVYTFNLNTTKSGNNSATAQITGANSGAYDISVVSPHCLVNVKRNVIVTPNIAVNMGTLLEGNANDDNKINIQDFGVLAATYKKSPGDSGYNAQADFDRNDKINITDFGMLAANYSKTSPNELN
jgi:hypothetical protein